MILRPPKATAPATTGINQKAAPAALCASTAACIISYWVPAVILPVADIAASADIIFRVWMAITRFKILATGAHSCIHNKPPK